MLDPSSGVPPFDPVKWEMARQRARPAIGHLILNWALIDTAMIDTIYKCRVARVAADGFDSLDQPISHKFAARLNEWIRLALPIAGRTNGDTLRKEALRLQAIRDDVAHNAEMIWLADDGDFVIRCAKGASRPITLKMIGEKWTGWNEDAKGKPLRYVRVYEERDIWSAIDGTHGLFVNMQNVRPAVSKAMAK